MKRMIYNVISLDIFDSVVKAVQDLVTCITRLSRKYMFVFVASYLALNLEHSLVNIADIRRGNAKKQMDDMIK